MVVSSFASFFFWGYGQTYALLDLDQVLVTRGGLGSIRESDVGTLGHSDAGESSEGSDALHDVGFGCGWERKIRIMEARFFVRCYSKRE